MKPEERPHTRQNARHTQGILAIALVSLIWATTFPLLKAAVPNLSAAGITVSRFTVAAVIFSPQLRCLNPEILRDGIELGLLLFLCVACQTIGLETASANRAGFIFSLNVVIVPLLGVLFNRPLLLKTLLAAGVALTGIGLMCWENGRLEIGDLLLFVDTLIYGVYMLVLQGITHRHSTLALTAVQLWTIALLSIVWAVPTLQIEQVHILGENFGLILYLGTIGTAAIVWLETMGQRWISASEAALLTTLDPVLTSIFSFWLLNEKFGVRGLIGTVLVLFALLLSQSNYPPIARKLIFGSKDL
jgi:drug/metabolite transporter (DMT)-like permease